MVFPTSWIKEWLRRTMLSDGEIVQALERAGIEIEQIISSNEIDKKVVVALVKKVVQHPGADRLHLVNVTTGESEFRVVCGAPNVREGIKVALAQIGAALPSGDRIAKAKLRGEVSEGMLCSELELGLGEDHNGIMELSSDAVVGTSLCDMYPADTIVDMKTPANRFDVQSAWGLAREVAAMTSAELTPLTAPPVKVSESGTPMIAKDAAARRFMLVHMRVDQSSLSPRELVARLRSAGVRSVGPVVDVTNYVMLDLGQPMHAYDAAKVKLPVTVRPARAGEELVTLDGVKRTLSPDDLVVADASGPIGLAGLMGGADTQVGPDTKEILLEAAVFDGVAVRKMAKRHGLRTEASARFERELPVQLPPLAVARAVELLGQAAAGRVLVASDQLNVWPWVQRIGVQASRLSRLLGFDISHKETADTLAKLGIEARPFDIVGESHKLVGKPYKFGASYKTNGTDAFDCSYLVDYLYSLIGAQAGFTALGQYETGRPVKESELAPGDAVFCEGEQDKLVTDHYFTRESDSSYVRHEVKPAKRVGHVGLYIGGGQVVHASPKDKKVVVAPLERFTSNAGYLGARRFVDDLTDFVTVPEVPWWRPDLRLPEDLAEEIVRVVGYERVPSTIPSWRPRRLLFDRERTWRRRVRDIMYGAGLFEVMTYSFVSQEQLADLTLEPKAHLKLKNPLSSEQAYLRSELLPSHLAVLKRNRTYAKDVGFYEISGVFVKKGRGEQPDEPLRLGVTLIAGTSAYARAKGVLDALAQALNVDVRVEPAEAEAFAPGRLGTVMLAGRPVGRIGQLHPERVRGLKMQGEVAYMEVDLSPLLEAASPRQFAAQSRFPTIARDLAVLLPAEVTWQAVADELSGFNAAYVDEYYGSGVPEGYRSLTLRLVVSHPDRTPTEPEAAEAEANVRRRLEHKLGAKARP